MARKRGQNEGSIYQRKDGLWVGQVTIQGKRQYKYFKTQKEARDCVNTTRTQVENGLTFAGAQVSLKEYKKFWLESIKTSVRPATFVQYEQITRQYIIPVFEKIKLKDLRPDQIQSLYNNYLEKGVSRRTVILIHAVLHRSLNYALKLGLINRNPAQAVTRPKLQRTEMHTLDDNQVRVLLSAVKDTRWEAFYHIAITTGLRQGELLALKWSDLDWRTKKLRIQRQVQRVKNQGLVFSEPKSKAGLRVIVLGNTTIEKLRVHQEIQLVERRIAGDAWKENDLIFTSSIGTPIEDSNLLKLFKDLLKRIGLPRIRFHDLRHTAATLMLLQGVHPKIVQERLGHSEISMTLNTYSHVLPSMQEDVAEKMDELITPIEIGGDLRLVGKVIRKSEI